MIGPSAHDQSVQQLLLLCQNPLLEKNADLKYCNVLRGRQYLTFKVTTPTLQEQGETGWSVLDLVLLDPIRSSAPIERAK